MKRMIIAAVALAATAAFAQQAAPDAAKNADAAKPVAIVNGETITKGWLDTIYAAMAPQMRRQYDENGGKGAFLDNYIRKRLLLQEAMKSGFDKKPDVKVVIDSARESALFDRYVRDVVAAAVVTEADIQSYYDQHRSEYATQEQMKLWHILIPTAGAQSRPKPEAAQRIQEINAKLREDILKSTANMDPAAAARITLSFFKNAARQYSLDSSAVKGGDLGWMTRGNLDPQFEAAAVSTPVGTISPVVESVYGYHLIYVEATKPAGFAKLDEVRGDIREKLLADRTPQIIQAVSQLTTELKSQGKVTILPENID